MNAFHWRRPSETLNDIKSSAKARTEPGRGRPKRPIEQMDMDGMAIAQFPSIHAAAARTRVPDPNIVRVLSGARKSAGGYRWRYLTAAEQVLTDKFGGAYSKATPGGR